MQSAELKPYGNGNGVTSTISLVHGSGDSPLRSLTLGQLLAEQSFKYGDSREAIVTSWTGVRLTYRQLYERCKIVARSLVGLGIRKGDRIGILSVNCERYVELFFAGTLIGAMVVVLNNTYTPVECLNAVKHTECRAVFIAPQIGSRNMLDHLNHLHFAMASKLPALKDIILVREGVTPVEGFMSYSDFISLGDGIPLGTIDVLESQVDPHETCNIQFTSGTTSSPKASMLTHYNIVNNSRYIGDQLRLTEDDIICCPPPLFHCFGLVLGLCGCITHGATFVLPSPTFDPTAVVEAVVAEKCTGLHSVPTMFIAVLEQLRIRQLGGIKIRTGVVAGSPIPPALMEELRQVFGLEDLIIAYGMTETSPVSFMTSVDDGLQEKLYTVGRVFPHTSAKVIGSDGSIVARGVRGELCVSGYCLHKGYLNDPMRTAEALLRDQDGVLWMRSGDEATLDEKGYCRITGRIKDIIIRGGENIYPHEIEDRLAQHPAVRQAAVVGVKDAKYGEVTAAFLQKADVQTARPPDAELQAWVGEVLGRHKVPPHIFWLGDKGVGDSFPLTGSGKVKKNVLRELGNRLIGVEMPNDA